ncbi:hypothetical protein MB02_12425 [Croceicoccus estronivorus]|uniref:LuxR C-terminal-related transcriptional regulator n=1 Tax=Croceicoccus estronivorus TaxID=1172626 RepID=UPI00083411E2|nr:LuxR C-terminal-related transcriptional regulator [Croceicoccus estronivorus]OCC23414.1 hypothetical protein MB02_12425 [Croceicoccus estronivorus]
MSTDWLIRSKLSPPPVTGSALVRSQGQRLLDDRIPLVILEAPAGYGKTTLLAQAFHEAQATGRNTAWLSTDKDDGDLRTLLSYLVAAIAETGIDLGSLMLAAPHGFADIAPRNVVVMLANALEAAAIDTPILVFIDDLHLAESEALGPILETLIAQTQGLCRFIISTRAQLNLALARMRGAGLLDLLGPSELRLSEQEVRTLIADHCSPTDLETVVERIEGWPVMVQLMRLSLDHHGGSGAALPPVAGHTIDLAAYLSEQVIAGLEPDMQTVLMAMSVCERFNGDLVNHLCGREDGWAVLDDLSHRGLLLVPVDMSGDWYRYHTLFGEFLLSRLKRTTGEEHIELSRQAARWFASEGLLRDAVRLAAGIDVQVTIDILREAGGWLVAFRGGSDTLRIIANLPEETLRADPYLRLGQIYMLAQESRLEQAKNTFHDLLSRTSSRSFRNAEDEALFQVSAGVLDALLRLYCLERIDPDRLLALSRRCRVPLPPLLSTMVTHLVGYARYCDGDYPEARHTGYAAANQARTVGADFIEAYSYLWLGDTHLELGELQEAEASFNRAVRCAITNFGPNCNQAVGGQVFLSELAYERDDLLTAEPLIQTAIEGIEQKDPWFSVYRSAYHVASEILLRKEGWTAAIALIDEATERLRLRQLTIYSPYLMLKRGEILTTAGHFDEAFDILTNCSTPGGEAGPNGTRLRVLERIAEARLALAMDKVDEATGVLEQIETLLADRGQVRRMIKVKTLLGLACYRSGDVNRANRLFREARNLSAPQKLIGPIIEEQPLLERFLNGPAIEILMPNAHPVALAEQTGPFRQAGPAIRLTRREKQVLKLLADGMSGKEIATEINLTVSTVMSYRKNLYRKLEANSRSRAIRKARMAGYI